MTCVVLAKSEALREKILLLVEDQGEEWRCILCSDGRQAVDALQEGAEVLLTDASGEALVQALQKHPVAAPPWIIGLDWTSPALDDEISSSNIPQLTEWLRERKAALPRMAQGMLPEAQRLACGLLRALSVPQRLGAWRFLPDMMALTAVHPPLLQDLKGCLYPLCAQRCSMTPGAVERSLRLAVEAVWSRGNLEALERFFGHSVDPERGKPTNREFLFRVQERMTIALRRIHG